MIKKKLFWVALVVASISTLVRADLLTHLKFEGNINDSSPNAITFTGSPGNYVPGPDGFGYAMQFEKTNGNVVYAEWLYSELASLAGQATISFWTKGSESLPYPAASPTVIFSANEINNWSRVSVQLPHSVENPYVFWDDWGTTGGQERAYKYVGDTPEVYKGQWNHWALVKNTSLGDSSQADARMKIYLNGVLWLDSFTAGYGAGNGMESLADITNIYIGAEKHSWYFYDGAIDDFRLYNESLNQAAVQALMVPSVTNTKATTPSPLDGAGGNAAYAVVLSWQPGAGAVSHNVYLGTNASNVTNATTASPEFKGNQTGSSNDPGTLVAGTTYYWRIDEVDSLNNVVKGDVWSFSIAPDSSANLLLHYEFNGNLNDSAGSGITLSERAGGSAGPYVPGPAGFGSAMSFNKTNQNAVFAEGIGSTLSAITDQMTISLWCYGSNRLPWDGDPTMIFSANDPATWSRISLQLPHNKANEYVFFDTWGHAHSPFNRIYKWLDGSPSAYKWRWNQWVFVKNVTASNTSVETAGMKIYLNGKLYVDSYTLGVTPTGTLAGLTNIYIGGEKQYWYFYDGMIDDVRIYNKEISASEVAAIMQPEIGPKANSPSPADAVAQQTPEADLSWNPGKGAISHDVYFGTSYDAVNNATTLSAEFMGNQTEKSYDLPYLNLDTTYYWRIDEVGGAGTVKGDVWSFSTVEYVLVEDFESYNDTDALRVLWIADPNTSNFLETANSSGGMQSMRIEYGSETLPHNTEVAFSLGSWDLTAKSMKTLSLRFSGDKFNADAEIYVKLVDNSAGTGKVVYGKDSIVKSEVWRNWNIDLQDFVPEVNLTDVSQIIVGVTDPNTDADVLYFDDIRLYPARCVSDEAIADWVGGDCTVKLPEFALLANDWGTQQRVTTGYDGVVVDPIDGNPNWTTGKFNKALNLEGSTYIELSPDVLASIDRQITVSMWAFGSVNQPRNDSVLQAFGPEGEVVLNIQLSWGDGEYNFWDTGFAGTGLGGAIDRIYKPASSSNYKGVWTHWVFTKNADASDADAANARMKIYCNGVLWHNSFAGPYGVGDGSSSIAGATELFIGGKNPAPYDGTIDDVRIYNVALTQGQIQSIADGSLGIAGNPLLWYKLDETSGTATNDSGNSAAVQVTWPFYYDTNLSSGSPEMIDISDLAVLASHWLELQLFPK